MKSLEGIVTNKIKKALSHGKEKGTQASRMNDDFFSFEILMKRFFTRFSIFFLFFCFSLLFISTQYLRMIMKCSLNAMRFSSMIGKSVWKCHRYSFHSSFLCLSISSKRRIKKYDQRKFSLFPYFSYFHFQHFLLFNVVYWMKKRKIFEYFK